MRTRKQVIAIGLLEAREGGGKVPPPQNRCSNFHKRTREDHAVVARWCSHTRLYELVT